MSTKCLTEAAEKHLLSLLCPGEVNTFNCTPALLHLTYSIACCSDGVLISFLDSELCSSSQLGFPQSFVCSMMCFAGPLSSRPVLSNVHLPLLKFHAQFADQFVHAFVAADLESSPTFQSHFPL